MVNITKNYIRKMLKIKRRRERWLQISTYILMVGSLEMERNQICERVTRQGMIKRLKVTQSYKQYIYLKVAGKCRCNN